MPLSFCFNDPSPPTLPSQRMSFYCIWAHNSGLCKKKLPNNTSQRLAANHRRRVSARPPRPGPGPLARAGQREPRAWLRRALGPRPRGGV